MAQFDLYQNPGGQGFLLDVQADIIETIKTRVVVPLLPPQRTLVQTPRLNPIFEVEGVRYVMVSQALSAVPISILRKRVDGMARYFDQIRDALDFLLIGF